jgi:hypothetical protein
MPAGDVVQSVIDKFLSKLELEGQLPSKVVEGVKRLAEEGALSDQGAIEAVLKKEPLTDDQAEDT